MASLYMQVSPLANEVNQSSWGLSICSSQIKIQKIIKHAELLDLHQIWGIQQSGSVYCSNPVLSAKSDILVYNENLFLSLAPCITP